MTEYYTDLNAQRGWMGEKKITETDRKQGGYVGSKDLGDLY